MTPIGDHPITFGTDQQTPTLSIHQPQQQETGKQPMDVSNASTEAMIPLARLPGKYWHASNYGFLPSGSASSRCARHVAGHQTMCEGWLIHFLAHERERRRLRHYWVLANGLISMYNEYNDGERRRSAISADLI